MEGCCCVCFVITVGVRRVQGWSPLLRDEGMEETCDRGGVMIGKVPQCVVCL